MSQYTYLVEYFHAGTIGEINEVILDHTVEDLTSAEQIISISWDDAASDYMVCYRVRKWLNGREEP